MRVTLSGWPSLMVARRASRVHADWFGVLAIMVRGLFQKACTWPTVALMMDTSEILPLICPTRLAGRPKKGTKSLVKAWLLPVPR